MADVLDVQDRFAQPVGSGVVGDAHLQHQLLQADTRGERGETMREPLGFVRRQRPGCADIEDQPVGQRAFTRRVRGELGAHRGEREQAHSLEPGVGHLAGHRVGRRGEVTDLGQREQTVIARVRPSHAIEQVDVLRRWSALQLEVRQPPQFEAFGQHRVQVAVERLLDERPVAGPRHRDTLDAEPLLGGAVGAADGDVETADLRPEGAAFGQRDDLGGGVGDLGSLAVAPRDDVDHGGCIAVPTMRAMVRRRDRIRPGRQLCDRHVPGDHADGAGCSDALCGGEAVAVCVVEADRVELPDPIEPSQVHLEDELLGTG